MDSPSPTTPPPIPPVQTPSPSTAPLTPEHMQALSLAEQRAKKLHSAARLAGFNGVGLAVFSGLALLWMLGAAMFGTFNWVSLVMGAGLGVLGWNELRGRRLLRQFDTRAPRILGINQLALLGLIVAYAGWMIAVGLLGPNPYEKEMRQYPQMTNMLGDIGELHKKLTVLIYGAVILATVVFQGLNAVYYFMRSKVLRQYLEETPDWIIALQRRQAGADETNG